MQGIIAIWSGAIVDIPAGWVICDGANETPDLRNKFIIGAGDTYDPDDTGGNLTHTHTFTSNTHRHTLPGGAQLQYGTGFTLNTNYVAVTGTTDAENHLPPYYALAFIMKT